MDFVGKFETEGWIALNGVFDPEMVGAVQFEANAQTDEVLASGSGRRNYLQVGEKRVMLPIALKGPVLDPLLYANPLLMRVMSQFLGPNMLIDNFTCVTALPNAAEQRQHVDHSSLFPACPGLEETLAPYAVTLVVPLVDLTCETGTTRLFPGTHRGRACNSPEEPRLKRGDCFLMDYRLSHQGTANVSLQPRPVLFIVYARPWFTDYCNFRHQPRVNIGMEELKSVAAEHRPLFRRVAGIGTLPLTESELLNL